MSAWAEAALFAAARAELVDQVIAPALERGADVVCDRYLDSSLAYQGIARGLGVDQVLALNVNAIRGLLPDMTFLLTVEPDEAAQRGEASDRIEREGGACRRAVETAYRELATIFPGRVVVLDGSPPPDESAKEVRDRIKGLS